MSFLDAALNDPEGHALVQEIHRRKAETERKAMTETLINGELQLAYGLSYARAYALCRDAGMGKEDAETAIEHLARNLSKQETPGADAGRVHSILRQATFDGR